MSRALTDIELRFCNETGCPSDLAAGARLDQAWIVRSDPLQIQGEGFSSDRPVLEQIHAIEISESARFGNYVIKLANAFALAKDTGIGLIIHPGFEFMADECEVGGVRFSTRQEPSMRRIVSGCYYHQTLQPLTQGAVDMASTIKDLKSGISLAPSSGLSLSEDHLVIHIRSGDIFTHDPPHPYYAQPPLAFYQLVLDHCTWSGVTLVYEDQSNPVIGQLKSHLDQVGVPFTEQSATLKEDLEVLLAARNLVIARGTFAYPIVAMSPRVRQVFTFDHYQTVSKVDLLWGQRIEGVQLHTVNDREGTYRDFVLANWKNSPEQRQMMLQYPATALELCHDDG